MFRDMPEASLPSKRSINRGGADENYRLVLKIIVNTNTVYALFCGDKNMWCYRKSHLCRHQ